MEEIDAAWAFPARSRKISNGNTGFMNAPNELKSFSFKGLIVSFLASFLALDVDKKRVRIHTDQVRYRTNNEPSAKCEARIFLTGVASVHFQVI